MDWMAFLYLTTGIIYIILEIAYVLKNKRIQLISAFRAMYAFSYGFFPAIMCYRSSLGISSIVGFDESYISSLLTIWIISIIQYIIFSFTYTVTKKSKLFYKPYRRISFDKLKISGIIIIVTAFISIVLWSRAFGSIWNFVLQADAVRARYSNIYNPFAFLEHVSKVIFFSTFIFLALIIQQKSLTSKIFNFLFFLLSLTGSFLIILMTDGRGLIGMLIIAMSFYLINNKLRNGGDIKKELVRLAIIFTFVFALIILMEPLLWYIRFGEFAFKTDAYSSIFEIIEKEFRFIIITRSVVLGNWYNMNIDYKIFAEIVNSFTAWIPSRLVPFQSPMGLWDYNTLLISNVRNASGQSPTDFVSASIYLLGLFGVIVVPLVWGVTIKKIETSLYRAEYNYYLDIIYVVLMQRMLLLPTHFAIYNLVLYLFFLFLGHLVVLVISKIKIKRGAYYG